MSLYSIKSETLTSIGDAIRAKGGTSDAIPVTSLADAITNLPSGGGGATGDGFLVPYAIEVKYKNPDLFSADRNKWLFDYLPDGKKLLVSVNGSPTKAILYDCTGDYSKLIYQFPNFGSNALGWSNEVTHFPEFRFEALDDKNQTLQLFAGSMCVRNLPNDFFYAWDSNNNKKFSTVATTKCQYGFWQFFYDCNNLRNIPELPELVNGSVRMCYEETFYNCYSLDKIEGLAIPSSTYSPTDNLFTNAFEGCNRISEMTFKVQADGTPYQRKWSNQYIDLSKAGYGFTESKCNEYNGLSKDDERVNTASGWVNENIHIERPDDWWASSAEYGRYNHDSAVRTINSLPDCSSGSSNTIKFRRDSGHATGPEGTNNSVGTLTEAEIAVATAKGWTVTYYG